MSIAVTVRAHAKINLGLRILGRWDDGFHEIETILHRIDLFDEIRLEGSQRIELEVSGGGVPSDQTNLCYRAADLLRKALGVPTGVRMVLTKRIPVGAGLGGGSADAAAVLQALPSVWGMQAKESLLASAAAALGSDVPFFLRDGSAVARGRGDLLDYFPLRLPYSILVCYPRVVLSTVWAYSRVTGFSSPYAVRLRDVLLQRVDDTDELRSLMTNDFEPVVFGAHPEIGRIKDEMLAGGAVVASLSGSGSSVFGLFPDTAGIRSVVELLRSRGYDLFLTEPMFAPGTAERGT